MKRIYNEYCISIVASFVFGGIILLYFFSIIDLSSFIGTLGASITLYFGLLKHQLENDKIFYELFKEMNSKYDTRFNDLINELKENRNRELNLEEKNIIIDYLNLCAEEYLWKTRGRIPKKVWNAWKAGIKENIKIRQIKDVYDYETSTENGKKSFYGLFEELNI